MPKQLGLYQARRALGCCCRVTSVTTAVVAYLVGPLALLLAALSKDSMKNPYKELPSRSLALIKIRPWSQGVTQWPPAAPPQRLGQVQRTQRRSSGAAVKLCRDTKSTFQNKVFVHKRTKASLSSPQQFLLTVVCVPPYYVVDPPPTPSPCRRIDSPWGSRLLSPDMSSISTQLCSAGP